MKSHFLVVLTAFLLFSFQDAEKIITIIDVRDKKDAVAETSTAGFHAGDVQITRMLEPLTHSQRMKIAELSKHEADILMKDRKNEYDVRFFKMYKGQLRNYSVWYDTELDYKTAAYKWLNDTTVSVTFLHADTTKNKTMKLLQMQDHASMLVRRE